MKGSASVARRSSRHPRGLLVAGVFEQDRELVTAQARQQVPGAHLPAQPGAHLDQKLVPGVVAQAVVDLLELVKVQHQQRPAPPGRLDQPRRGVGVQPTPVGQAGQGVMGGVVAQLLHQAGAAQRDREVAGQGLQHGQVLGGEGGDLPEPVGDPQRPPHAAGVGQRDHHRVPKSVLGQPVPDTRILGGSAGQQRFLLGQRTHHHRVLGVEIVLAHPKAVLLVDGQGQRRANL